MGKRKPSTEPLRHPEWGSHIPASHPQEAGQMGSPSGRCQRLVPDPHHEELKQKEGACNGETSGDDGLAPEDVPDEERAQA